MDKAEGTRTAESTAHLEALSRAELVELVKMYSRLFVAVDGFWYLATKELVDEDTATACDLWVWDKYFRYELKRLRQLMKTESDDLGTFITAFGLSPWSSNLSYSFTQDRENMLTFTVLQCPTLEAIKKEGAGRENTFCRQVEAKLFQMYIQSFNPRGQAVPVALPPETNEARICCQWQFVITE